MRWKKVSRRKSQADVFPDGVEPCAERSNFPHAHRRTFVAVAIKDGLLEKFVGGSLNHTTLSIAGQRCVEPGLDARWAS